MTEKLIYKPADREYYLVDEYTFNLRSGETKPTGRRWRLVETCKPEDEGYEIFVKKARRDGRVIVFNPSNFIPGAYELVD